MRWIDVAGKAKTIPLLRDPLPLTHGKGALAIFQAGVDYVPTLRQLGHKGLSVQHYKFDRALLEPLQRLFTQRHAALAEQVGAASSSAWLGSAATASDGVDCVYWVLRS